MFVSFDLILYKNNKFFRGIPSLLWCELMVRFHIQFIERSKIQQSNDCISRESIAIISHFIERFISFFFSGLFSSCSTNTFHDLYKT